MGLAVVVGLGSLTLTGCGPEEETAPTTVSAPTTSSDAPGHDVSAKILKVSQRDPIATGKGTLTTSTSKDEVTLEILELRATATGTVLTYRIRSEAFTSTINRTTPERLPRLVDRASRTAFLTSTVVRDRDDPKSVPLCVCTGIDTSGSAAPPQQIRYAPLPDSVTQVDVVMTGIPPVAVPVTRA